MVAGRRSIAFFEFADVFEDFYPHLGVNRRDFAESWSASGSHAFASVIQSRIGDVTWYPLSLAPALPPSQHERGITVVFSRSSWVHRRLWSLFYMKSWSWRLRPAYTTFSTVASYAAPFSSALFRNLRRDRPDVFFVQDYSSGRFDVLWLLSRLLRASLVAYHAGSTEPSFRGSAVRKLTLRRADALILSSEREAQRVVAEFGADPSRCHVVLTPIDTDTFHPGGHTPAEELPQGPRSLIFVGRLDDRVKRISNLLRAFDRAAGGENNIHLVVVGDGPDAGPLRTLGHDLLGERVRFLGWVSEQTRLAELYRSADALVLPSLHEGFPTVVGESLACGTPVIATDVGGIREVVHDGKSGRLIPPEDDAALTRALEEVVRRPEDFRAMRTEARRRAEERLSPEVIGEALSRIFAGLRERCS